MWWGMVGMAGMVWYGVIWCNMVWCGVVWCGVVWCAWWRGTTAALSGDVTTTLPSFRPRFEFCRNRRCHRCSAQATTVRCVNRVHYVTCNLHSAAPHFLLMRACGLGMLYRIWGFREDGLDRRAERHRPHGRPGRRTVLHPRWAVYMTHSSREQTCYCRAVTVCCECVL